MVVISPLQHARAEADKERARYSAPYRFFGSTHVLVAETGRELPHRFLSRKEAKAFITLQADRMFLRALADNFWQPLCDFSMEVRAVLLSLAADDHVTPANTSPERVKENGDP